MPSEIEWAMLSKDGGTGSLIPPPLKERAVTASLGLAMYDNSLALTAQGDSAPDLLDRADTALYRAKAAGRNQVIAFENILNNCGRVIEHDSQTKIVAIDRCKCWGNRWTRIQGIFANILWKHCFSIK